MRDGFDFKRFSNFSLLLGFDLFEVNTFFKVGPKIFFCLYLLEALELPDTSWLAQPLLRSSVCMVRPMVPRS